MIAFYIKLFAVMVLVGIANELPRDMSVEVAAVALRLGDPYFAIVSDERLSKDVLKAFNRQTRLVREFQARLELEETPHE